MARSKRILMNQFDGGLDTVTDKTLMQINRSPHLLNVDVIKGGGAIKSRKGYRKYYTVGDKAIRFLGFYKANNIVSLITCDSDGAVQANKLTGFVPPEKIPTSESNPDIEKQPAYWATIPDQPAISTKTTISVPLGFSVITAYGSPFTVETDKGVYTATLAANDIYYKVTIESGDGIAEITPTISTAPIARLVSPKTVRIELNTSVKTANAMEVYRRTIGGAWGLIAETSNLTTYEDMSVPNGIYEYRVRHKNTRGTVLYAGYSKETNRIKVGG